MIIVYQENGETKMKEQDEIYPALATDLYEFTMAKGYLDNKMEKMRATFDLFIRNLPENWGFFIACGVDDAIAILRRLVVPRRLNNPIGVLVLQCRARVADRDLFEADVPHGSIGCARHGQHLLELRSDQYQGVGSFPWP